VLQIDKIRGGIADGEIAGQIDTMLSERDQRFGMSLVLRNAKVSDLTGETDKPIDGRLTASLQLEGRWDDPATRRGRGDVIVEGRDMYRVPVMFGLMQMATLAVPLDSFNRAGLRPTRCQSSATCSAAPVRICCKSASAARCRSRMSAHRASTRSARRSTKCSRAKADSRDLAYHRPSCNTALSAAPA
jgi:hypothetical protein